MSDAARGAAILAVAVLLTFSNTLDNAFHLDDFYRVVDNPGIQRRRGGTSRIRGRCRRSTGLRSTGRCCR